MTPKPSFPNFEDFDPCTGPTRSQLSPPPAKGKWGRFVITSANKGLPLTLGPGVCENKSKKGSADRKRGQRKGPRQKTSKSVKNVFSDTFRHFSRRAKSPDPPILACLDFLAFFLFRFSLLFSCVSPLFFQGFLGKSLVYFRGFPCIFFKKARVGGSGIVKKGQKYFSTFFVRHQFSGPLFGGSEMGKTLEKARHSLKSKESEKSLRP